MVVKKGYQLNDGKGLPIWGPEYEVRFDVKINSWSRKYRSIFRFYSGKCCSKWSQRVLRLLAKNGRLELSDERMTYDRWISSKNYRSGEWYSFAISQKKEASYIYLKISRPIFSYFLSFRMDNHILMSPLMVTLDFTTRLKI